jgi:hypothetical protein
MDVDPLRVKPVHAAFVLYGRGRADAAPMPRSARRRTRELYVLGDARKQSNRDLSGLGAAPKANFIIELHLKSTLTAAASIRAGHGGASRTALHLLRSAVGRLSRAKRNSVSCATRP